MPGWEGQGSRPRQILRRQGAYLTPRPSLRSEPTRSEAGYNTFGEKWECLVADSFTVSLLRWGYKIPFRDKPLLSWEPIINSSYQDPQRNLLLQQAVDEMLLKGAIRPLESNLGPGFYSRLFLVPTKTGEMRPVIDLSALNKFVESPTFKMDTAELVRMDLQPGMCVTSIDLKDAYFNIPIHKSHWKYLRFQVLGKVYYFIALPFGLSTAPRLFTKIAKQVKKMALKRGIYIHQYIDDWLIRALSKLACSQNTQSSDTVNRGVGLNYQLSKVRTGTNTGCITSCRTDSN